MVKIERFQDYSRSENRHEAIFRAIGPDGKVWRIRSLTGEPYEGLARKELEQKLEEQGYAITS